MFGPWDQMHSKFFCHGQVFVHFGRTLGPPWSKLGVKDFDKISFLQFLTGQETRNEAFLLIWIKIPSISLKQRKNQENCHGECT